MFIDWLFYKFLNFNEDVVSFYVNVIWRMEDLLL